jgi:hypothetical protein
MMQGFLRESTTHTLRHTTSRHGRVGRSSCSRNVMTSWTEGCVTCHIAFFATQEKRKGNAAELRTKDGRTSASGRRSNIATTTMFLVGSNYCTFKRLPNQKTQITSKKLGTLKAFNQSNAFPVTTFDEHLHPTG